MKKDVHQKLVFVYNANSGARNAILDSMHKVLSPTTYACSLCDITYGVFNEKKLWKKFRKQSKREMVFLHKDEFAKTYGSKFGHKFEFPIVLLEGKNGLEVLIHSAELNQLGNANSLIAMIGQRT